MKRTYNAYEDTRKGPGYIIILNVNNDILLTAVFETEKYEL